MLSFCLWGVSKELAKALFSGPPPLLCFPEEEEDFYSRFSAIPRQDLSMGLIISDTASVESLSVYNVPLLVQCRDKKDMKIIQHF